MSKKVHKNKKKFYTVEQRYHLIKDAKDGIFSIITFNKYRWGYENWCRMTTAITIGDYATIRNIVNGFRDSQSKRSVIAFLDDIDKFNKW